MKPVFIPMVAPVNLLIASLLAASACGGRPTSPSSSGGPPGGGLPFQATRYLISIVGDSVRCGDIRAPATGTAVSLNLVLQPDATGWTAVAEDTVAGTITLRFQQGSGPAGPLEIPLSGTARGFADDRGLPIGVVPPMLNGTRIAFGATGTETIPLSGLIPFQDFSNGTFDGPVLFSRNGVTATCPAGAAGWTMNRFSRS